MKEAILRNGMTVTYDETKQYSKCRGCDADDIIWALTKNGKNIPIRFSTGYNAWICHFEDCPQANKFRKKEKV